MSNKVKCSVKAFNVSEMAIANTLRPSTSAFVPFFIDSSDVTFQCSKIDEKLIGYTVTTSYEKVLEWISLIHEIRADKESELKVHMNECVLPEILQYSDKDLQKHFKEKNNEWRHWCINCCLYMCYKFILKYEPVCEVTWNHANISKKTDVTRGLIFGYL